MSKIPQKRKQISHPVEWVDVIIINESIVKRKLLIMNLQLAFSYVTLFQLRATVAIPLNTHHFKSHCSALTLDIK